MKGYFKIQHGILDHPLFSNEPYTEREAWIWLIDKAAFKDSKIRFKSKMINIKKGQVPTTWRKLFKKWGWGQGKTQKFIKLLKNEGMIDTQVDTGFLIISICNYSNYQDVKKEVDTQIDTQVDTQVDTNRIKDNKDNKFNLNTPVMDKSITAYTKDFEKFWLVYPKERRKEKPNAFKEWKKAIKKNTPEEITKGLEFFINTKEVKDGFAPYPAKWLKNERWLETLVMAIQATEKENAIDQLGKLRWRHDRHLKGQGSPLSKSELRYLQEYEKNNGKTTWTNLKDFKEKMKQTAINKFRKYSIHLQ